jgi:hypothetical protein
LNYLHFAYTIVLDIIDWLLLEVSWNWRVLHHYFIISSADILSPALKSSCKFDLSFHLLSPWYLWMRNGQPSSMIGACDWSNQALDLQAALKLVNFDSLFWCHLSQKKQLTHALCWFLCAHTQLDQALKYPYTCTE